MDNDENNFALVPRKLDPAMASAGWSKVNVGLINGDQAAMEQLWIALVDAAPKPEPVPATNQAGEVDGFEFATKVDDPFGQPHIEATKLALTATPETFPRDSYGLAQWLDKALFTAVPRDYETSSGWDAADAAAYIRDWCPDHVRDYVASLATQPATSQEGDACAFVDCPPGLFRWQGIICFKSEYSSKPGQQDAYCVSSGEYFWGGTSGDLAARRALIVTSLAATPTPPTLSEDLREACERLLLAMTTRALRGRDHVPSMRDEQTAASALRAALARAQVKAS